MKFTTIITTLFFLGCISVQGQPITEWKTGQIHETGTNDFDYRHVRITPQAYLHTIRIGVESLGDGHYHDSLISRFDKIVEYYPQIEDTVSNRYYHAIFNGDTLSYRERKTIFIKTYLGRKILEVESLLSPHQRFGANIDSLDTPQITALTDSMRYMKTYNSLLNNEQTCLFYALNCFLDANGINPAPVITRNTNFTNGNQLNAFFNHILKLKATYKCRYSVMKKANLPDQCVIVFQDTDKQYIHAVYYRKDRNEYYTKNGFWCPAVLKSLRPIIKCYKQADTLLIYSL